MGANSGNARAKEPPVHDYRRKTGRFQGKVGKVERDEIHDRSIAKKQESGISVLILWLIVFGAGATLLYMLLSYITRDDADEGWE